MAAAAAAATPAVAARGGGAAAAAAQSRRQACGAAAAVRRRRRCSGDGFAELSRGFAKFLAENGPKHFFEMIVFIAAIDSVKFSSKSELSSRFFGRLKFLCGGGTGIG